MTNELHVGFSGSRHGCSAEQLLRVHYILKDLAKPFSGYSTFWFHHGDCVGADAQVMREARAIGFKIYRHPPLDKSMVANTSYDETDPEFSYHGRNQRIVSRTSILVAAPYDRSQIGGTWWTIDCARRMKKPRIIVFRDGNIDREELA